MNESSHDLFFPLSIVKKKKGPASRDGLEYHVTECDTVKAQFTTLPTYLRSRLVGGGEGPSQ